MYLHSKELTELLPYRCNNKLQQKLYLFTLFETGKDNQKFIANNDLYETQIVTCCICIFSLKYKHLIAFKRT